MFRRVILSFGRSNARLGAPLRRTFSQNASSFASKSVVNGSSKIILGTTLIGSLAYFVTSQRAHAEETQNAQQSAPASSEQRPADEAAQDAAERPVAEYKYVIVGGGTAGYAAMKQLRALDPEAKILVVGAEPDLPYMRPPLSKELWKSDDPAVAQNLRFKAFDGSENAVWLAESDKAYEGVTVQLNTRAMDLDANRNMVLLSDDSIVKYSKLLIATGGWPNWLPTVAADVEDSVSTYRTLTDFRRLDAVTRDPSTKHVVVIGGGFLGTELTVGLGLRGKKDGYKVTQVMPEPGVMAAAFPPYLSDLATETVRSEAGADVHTGRLVDSVKRAGDGKRVEVALDNGTKLDADHVVLCVGIRPNVHLARMGKLEIDDKTGGILVNTELQARSDVYVAGDVASYYDPILGRRRVEHHDHAVSSGELAARNMAGGKESYAHIPMFWGDIGSLGYEAVGQVDSKLDMVGVWEQPADAPEDAAPKYDRGFVYYLNPADQKVRGVLLWHLFGKVDDARRVIKGEKAFSDASLLKTQISLEEIKNPDAELPLA